MANKNQILKTISKFSLGTLIILTWLFFWIRADVLFPVNTQEWKIGYILTYIIMVSFVFAFDTLKGSRTEDSLLKASALKRFPVFIIGAGITLALLLGLTFIVKPDSLNTVSQAMAQVSFGVLMIHAFMVSIGEELVFRGWLVEQFKNRRFSPSFIAWGTSIIFAIFHAGMGKSFITLLTYIPLGLLFYYVKRRFSPKTNMANAGVHFGWNLFVLGFLA